MNTTNDKAHAVPSFWQKWWNAFMKFFKGSETCARAAEESSARGAKEAKTAESKGMA